MLKVLARKIDQYINQYYRHQDYATFKARSRETLLLDINIENFITSYNVRLVDSPDQNFPSRTWRFTFNNDKKSEFKGSLSTTLKISKVAPLFYIQHEVSMRHRHKNRIAKFLTSESTIGRTEQECNLHDKIREILDAKGYKELDWLDMRIAVHRVKIPETVALPGPYVTIQDLLFDDVLNLCSNE